MGYKTKGEEKVKQSVIQNANCGRADHIRRQGGWEETCIVMTSTLTRRGVWSGTFLGETPVKTNYLPGMLKISHPMRIEFREPISIWRGSGVGQALLDTFGDVSLCKGAKTCGARSVSPTIVVVR